MKRSAGSTLCVVFSSLTVACLEGPESDIDFGTGGTPPPAESGGATGGPPPGDSGVPPDPSGEDGIGETGGSDDGGLGETSSAGDDGGTTASTWGTSTGAGPSSSSGGGPGDPQPEEGMYADCRFGSECDEVMEHRVCVTYNQGGSAVDGFCSYRPCVDPAADCDAPPSGTSQPKCISLNVDDVPTTVCALDCSLGQTCPAGMLCRTEALGGLCM